MKIENPQRLIRNIFLSLFIYALPVLLMFFSFSITGEKPWKEKARKAQQKEQSSTKKPTKP